MTTITETEFSDIYITDKGDTQIAYIQDKNKVSALVELQADDFDAFFKTVVDNWDGKNSSYSVHYDGVLYRVERSVSISGIQYCARKMPKTVPSIRVLGYPNDFVNYMVNLRRSSGLILFAGPTGSGKTTAISALLKEFLMKEGGFAYTIEDPAEQPLDGIYKVESGGLGVCSQTSPINNDWGASLKSALRSKPRYIMLGEIRSPDAASEVLRAATSGHLVLATIHANNVSDAINAVVKYASSGDMSEDLAYDLFSRGMLCVVHQNLVGRGIKKPQISFLFANPDTFQGDSVRGLIKSGKLNLGTVIEQQMIRMAKGLSLFENN
ncbi:MAG: GspE family protein [Alphaproteobacteria bacterium]|nr:GspE family protein [Alphaproteobacteria bacterium]